MRAISPMKAIAGDSYIMHCPFSGYPIETIRWEKSGQELVSSKPIDLHIYIASYSHLSEHTQTYFVRLMHLIKLLTLQNEQCYVLQHVVFIVFPLLSQTQSTNWHRFKMVAF